MHGGRGRLLLPRAARRCESGRVFVSPLPSLQWVQTSGYLEVFCRSTVGYWLTQSTWSPLLRTGNGAFFVPLLSPLWLAFAWVVGGERRGPSEWPARARHCKNTLKLWITRSKVGKMFSPLWRQRNLKIGVGNSGCHSQGNLAVEATELCILQRVISLSVHFSRRCAVCRAFEATWDSKNNQWNEESLLQSCKKSLF